MNFQGFFASFAVLFAQVHPSPCRPCELKSISCFVLWPPIAILGTCSVDQTWKACYSLGELTSCCCAPMIKTTLERPAITKEPSNKQCTDCTEASKDCYLTDPFDPAIGFCLAGYDFYGCFNKFGDIASCCCKPNIQPDCTIAHV